MTNTFATNRRMDSINQQISVLYRLSQTYISKKMKAFGLSHSQIAVLLHLSKAGEIKQNQITDYLSLDKGSVSSMIKKLGEKGFIQKFQDPNDKRATMLSLSYKANLLLEKIRNASEELTSGILVGFSLEEKLEVLAYLERMKENVESIHSEVRTV